MAWRRLRISWRIQERFTVKTTRWPIQLVLIQTKTKVKIEDFNEIYNLLILNLHAHFHRTTEHPGIHGGTDEPSKNCVSEQSLLNSQWSNRTTTPPRPDAVSTCFYLNECRFITLVRFLLFNLFRFELEIFPLSISLSSSVGTLAGQCLYKWKLRDRPPGRQGDLAFGQQAMKSRQGGALELGQLWTHQRITFVSIFNLSYPNKFLKQFFFVQERIIIIVNKHTHTHTNTELEVHAYLVPNLTSLSPFLDAYCCLISYTIGIKSVVRRFSRQRSSSAEQTKRHLSK